MEDTNIVRVNFSALFSIETLGIITGIVLCILQGIGTINIGWFWATFPFWIPFAVDFVIFLIIVIIVAIIVKMED